MANRRPRGRGRGRNNGAVAGARGSNPSTAAVAVAAAGADIAPRPEHTAEVNKTKSHEIASMNNYRNRLIELFAWWKDNYPSLHEELVFELTDEEKNDPLRQYHKATHDMHYDKLESRWVEVFLSAAKKWKDEEKKIVYGFSHLRKYHDAILKCSNFSKGGKLTEKYKTDMDAFLDNLEKEKTVAKSNNQVDEKDADAIGINLVEQICKWAVASGTAVGIFVWAFMVCQWNCMGRTVNVDPLGFHNFTKSPHDSVVITYDSNKKDKTGAKVSPKHCYSNPRRPFISMNLALGCYLSIFQNKFDRTSDKLFHAQGSDGSASNSYCKAIKKLIFGKQLERDEKERRAKRVRESCRDGHFHPHGVRKGAGTHVTTSTMDPPPIPSVLMRGEWSLGKVLEVYWKYSMIGDTYLGRCLAGFDPDEPDFGMLPPHFKEGMGNPLITEAMELCFGVILKRFGGQGIEGVLLLFLASIVYHADSFLIPQIAEKPGHPFMNIPILNRPELLHQLQELVTLEPAGDVMQATGVPRHVKMMEKVREVFSMLQDYAEEVRELKRTLPTMVKDAIEEKATESGQVTATYVLEQMEAATATITTTLEERLTVVVNEATSQLNLNNAPEVSSVAQRDGASSGASSSGERVAQLYQSYKYSDSSAKANSRNQQRTDWDVPMDFDLPKSDLFAAWSAWLRGYPCNKSKNSSGEIYSAPVKPLWLLVKGNLPTKIKKKFDNAWRPVLELMHEEVKASVRGTPVDRMNDLFIRSTYDLALKNVCIKYPDIREQLVGGHAISTCSKVVRRHNANKRKAASMN